MLIKINDVAIEEPTAVEVGISDICSSVGSGVNQLGESFRDKITVKRSVSCNWPPLSGEKMSALLLAMEESCFELEYPDPQTAQPWASSPDLNQTGKSKGSRAGSTLKWAGVKPGSSPSSSIQSGLAASIFIWPV